MIQILIRNFFGVSIKLKSLITWDDSWAKKQSVGIRLGLGNKSENLFSLNKWFHLFLGMIGALLIGIVNLENLKTSYSLGGWLSKELMSNILSRSRYFQTISTWTRLSFPVQISRGFQYLIAEINFRFCGYGCWCFPDGSVDIMDGKGPVLDEIDG